MSDAKPYTLEELNRRHAWETGNLRGALAAASAERDALREKYERECADAYDNKQRAENAEAERAALSKRVEALEKGLRGIESEARGDACGLCVLVRVKARALLRMKP